MNSEKITVVRLIHEAMDAVEEKRAEEGLSKNQKTLLEKLSVEIRSWEREIISEEEARLISVLEKDAQKLSELITELNNSIDDIQKISEKMKKLTKGLEILTQIVKGAMSLKFI